MAAKPLSVAETICRSGSQRATCSMIRRPQPASFLRRRLCLRAYRSDGARTIKNGSAQMAQGISRQKHDRKPSHGHFVKASGLRWKSGPRLDSALILAPHRRSTASSRSMTTGPVGTKLLTNSERPNGLTGGRGSAQQSLSTCWHYVNRTYARKAGGSSCIVVRPVDDVAVAGCARGVAQPAPEATGMAVQTIPPGQVHGVVGGHVQGSNGLDAGRLWDVLVVTTGYRERR
jgi:hypothetical protein